MLLPLGLALLGIPVLGSSLYDAAFAGDAGFFPRSENSGVQCVISLQYVCNDSLLIRLT